jgi:polysaccharide pyruvyl transferase WcaK-like protein
MSINIIVTGYYFERNLGDDLFEKIGREIFTEKNFKQKINKIDFMKIDKINSNEVYFKCDKLILFGGETLNNYFLDKIIEFKNKNSQCEMYAIGVSTNQSYDTLCNKINIFDKIIFRNKADYNYFYPRLGDYVKCSTDIVFNLKYVKSKINKVGRNVGFFVAMPIYSNLNNKEKELFLKNCRELLNILIKNNYIVYMFPMCCNEKNTEDDLILIKKIIETYTPLELKKFKLFSSNKKILEELPKMKYNFCWRYHSIILSIIFGIPFIALSNTTKVKNIIIDSNLESLLNTIDKNEDFLPYLKENKHKIRSQLEILYKKYHIDSKKNYLNFENYNGKRESPPFYISPNDYKTIIQHITQIYEKYSLTYDNDYNTNLILYHMCKTINSPYFYGLREKIFIGIKKLQGEIKWLIDDMILNSNMFFYYSVNKLLKKYTEKIELKPDTINMTYLNQFDYDGLHRSGWSYVLNNLKEMNHANGILCDFYLDRTFHWNNIIFAQLKIIPYTNPWIGFIHHTTDIEYSDYNTVALFENKLFLLSLKYCKGLIVLSKDLAKKVKDLLRNKKFDVPVFDMVHPTEFISDTMCFNLDSFKSNPHKKIIQVGAWLRDTMGIFNLKLLKEDESKIKLHKAVLIGKQMESYYNLEENDNIVESTLTELDTNTIKQKKYNKILNLKLFKKNKKQKIYNNVINEIETETESLINVSRDKKDRRISLTKEVEVIRYLNNNEYDILLKNNIVFIKLIGASAVNTVLECIIRNTPIVINKLPAIVEILGETYPLYYNTLEESTEIVTMKNIEKAYNYLKNLNKNKFRIETFKNDFNKILKKLIF